MAQKELQGEINNLLREMKFAFNGLANVYENEIGTGITIEYNNGLIVQLDFPFQTISFDIIRLEQAHDLVLFNDVQWDNDYTIQNVFQKLKHYFQKYQANRQVGDLLILPKLDVI